MEHIGWVVVAKDGDAYANCADHGRNRAINSFLDHANGWRIVWGMPQITWKWAYRCGYRCRKIYMEDK